MSCTSFMPLVQNRETKNSKLANQLAVDVVQLRGLCFRKKVGFFTYVNPPKLLLPATGLVIGETVSGMLVQRSSKLATQILPATFGRKLGWISRASSFLQLIVLNHLWFFISLPPPGPLPRRLLASFCNNCQRIMELSCSSFALHNNNIIDTNSKKRYWI